MDLFDLDHTQCPAQTQHPSGGGEVAGEGVVLSGTEPWKTMIFPEPETRPPGQPVWYLSPSPYFLYGTWCYLISLRICYFFIASLLQ